MKKTGTVFLNHGNITISLCKNLGLSSKFLYIRILNLKDFGQFILINLNPIFDIGVNFGKNRMNFVV